VPNTRASTVVRELALEVGELRTGPVATKLPEAVGDRPTQSGQGLMIEHPGWTARFTFTRPRRSLQW
jgi:hypothetical protein